MLRPWVHWHYTPAEWQRFCEAHVRTLAADALACSYRQHWKQLAAIGFVAQLAFRRAVWQRTIWQITVISLLLLPASEWTGFGRGLVGVLVNKKRVVQNAPAPGFRGTSRPPSPTDP